jgi:dTMP kinase
VSCERLSRAARTPDRFEREDRAFFERVRQAYLVLARSDPERIRVIDASGSQADIKKRVEEELIDV